jgi:pimeloyl-ACP methyl ester carboxylesterase
MHGILKVLVWLLLFVAMNAVYAKEQLTMHCSGNGKPVYLIGGGPAFTTWNLEPVQQALKDDFQVCRWDMRGVGENADLPMSRRASALSQWLDDMGRMFGNEQVILWGHSWGALQVLLFASQHPERVTHIVLSNPVDPALRSLEDIEQKRFVHPEVNGSIGLDEMGTEAEALHKLRSKIASYFADEQKGWAYAELFTRKDANNALNVQIWDEYRQAPLSEQDLAKVADKISGVIYCGTDVLQPESESEYRGLLPEVEHHVLSDCGHFPWEEKPEEYFAVLRELLKH